MSKAFRFLFVIGWRLLDVNQPLLEFADGVVGIHDPIRVAGFQCALDGSRGGAGRIGVHDLLGFAAVGGEIGKSLDKIFHIRDDGETVGVAGEIGKYAAVARRKGGRWWLGAITNWDSREIALSTDFLGGGEWDVEVFEDAPDADVNAEHYVRRTFTVKAGDTLKAKLAPGGGFAASFSCAKPETSAKLNRISCN